MKNAFGNKGPFEGRVNLSEIKSKSEEERVKYLIDALIGTIKSKCEEVDLDLVSRYKVMKGLMDLTTVEVKAYADKIKKDQETLSAISGDIGVEDVLYGKTSDGTELPYEKQSREIYKALTSNEKMNLLLNNGFRVFEYSNGSMYVSQSILILERYFGLLTEDIKLLIEDLHRAIGVDSIEPIDMKNKHFSLTSSGIESILTNKTYLHLVITNIPELT